MEYSIRFRNIDFRTLKCATQQVFHSYSAAGLLTIDNKQLAIAITKKGKLFIVWDVVAVELANLTGAKATAVAALVAVTE